jgi:tricorn protease
MKLPQRLSILLLACAASSLTAQEPVSTGIDARMMQMPAVSKTQIAFVYADDIWIAPKAGGEAVRLSTPQGPESFPRFSPDGKQLAFSGNYDGNMDLYVMPVGGGEPRRITHHGANDRLLGWYPDGKSLLFSSHMTSFTERAAQLFKVPVVGGLPEKLPMPYGEFGEISPDGRFLAYTTISNDFSTWKRYRGGMAPDIWLYDLEKNTAENITHNDANDTQPMWHGDTIYFLSDRDAHERANLWAYSTTTKQTRQVTRFTDADVHFPSIGPDDLVFENSGRLFLLDLATEQAREVHISVVTDSASLRPRLENVSGLIRNGTISPTGKRALFEARGKIFSVPAEHGVIRNLTEGAGIAERYPAWSPDGKWIAFFSDRSGEYELTMRPAEGHGPEQTLTHLGPGFRYQPQWAPDSKKIVFIDQAMRIWLYDLDTKTPREIDRQLWAYEGDLQSFHVNWSADGRWLAYAKDLLNRQTAIALYDTTTHARTQVTSGYFSDEQPTFDLDGKYLYYISDRHFEAIHSDFDSTWVYANSTALMAVPLRKDLPSPMAPRDDEEQSGGFRRVEPAKPEEKKEEPKPEEPKKEPSKLGSVTIEEQKPQPTPAPGAPANVKVARVERKVPPVRIDLDGFESRAVVLPPGGGNLTSLIGAQGKVIFARKPRAGAAPGSNTTLHFYDLEKREEKQILDAVQGVELSADGKKLLIARNRQWGIVNVMENQVFKAMDTFSMEATIDPPAEWRQIFNDAWRFERDFFYDPGMHGVDWPAMRERYGRLLPACVTRRDLNYVLGELLGELNVSHAYRGGGDIHDAPTRSVGYLGCDFALDQGAYRIAHILETAPWDSLRSPLLRSGIKVQEGDWLLAVNGRPIDPAQDPWAAFQDLAGKTVLLTVNNKPSLDGSHEVLAQTLSSEAPLRQHAWVEANRRRVDAESGGKIGYIYVRDTASDGQSDLYQQFRAQFARPGLIIDERWNSGGQIPDRFVELLGRRVTNYWSVRDGHDWQTPEIAHHGPEAMLVNGWSGSGGDCFPWLFRKDDLGPLIGQRTWGGLVGMTGSPSLIDGGHVTVPTFGIYDTKGNWIIEGHGVDPDISVVDNPAEMLKGADPQLERAIEEVKKQLEEHPPLAPKKPAYTNRTAPQAK